MAQCFPWRGQRQSLTRHACQKHGRCHSATGQLSTGPRVPLSALPISSAAPYVPSWILSDTEDSIMVRSPVESIRQKCRFKRTTDSQHAFPIAPNLLKQDFSAERPSEKWAADIPYLWTSQGWLYMAVVLNFFARRVVGWAVSDSLHKELALEVLSKALAIRRPSAGLVHHADRSNQYCSTGYQAELKKHGIQMSLSWKDNCFDNAGGETFFKTLKSELVWRTVIQTRAEAKAAIGRYIDGFYNPIRRHSTLDYVSPVQFERMAE